MRIWMQAAGAALAILASGAHAGAWEDGYADYQRKDYAAAVAKWRSVAQSGNREAQSLLGIMYAFGQGVPQDYPGAIKWLHMAAAQGEPKAMFKLEEYWSSRNFDKLRARNQKRDEIQVSSSNQNSSAMHASHSTCLSQHILA